LAALQHLWSSAIAYANDVVELFYPRTCGGCNAHLSRNEKHLCIQCATQLPRTYFWDYDHPPVEELFWGKLIVNEACSYLHFEEGNTAQELLHRLKYNGQTGVGLTLGMQFGFILKEKGWFTDADVIIPLPLHPSKELRRGYNQSKFIADGIAEVYCIPVWTETLIRTVSSESQTRKSRFERAENVQAVFEVTDSDKVKGRNVILVDDVITTGATLIAAGEALRKAGIKRLYIATLAVAS